MTQIIDKPNNPYGIPNHKWHLLEILYPGSYNKKTDPLTIKGIVDLCDFYKVDPLQKLIIPLTIKGQETLFPTIGLYRLQAARTNRYIGLSEPEFGKVITTELGGQKVSYPEWCKLTVKRLVGNYVAEFTAVELWMENYKTPKDSMAPNEMWKKRGYGMLAKCTEAQVLRKAFPEDVTQQPTFEEMEGAQDLDSKSKVREIAPPQNIGLSLDNLLSAQENPVLAIGVSDNSLELQRLIDTHKDKIPEELVNKWCNKAQVESVEQLSDAQAKACIELIEKKIKEPDIIETEF